LTRPSPASCSFGKAAEALSPATLDSYERILKLWLDHVGDVEVSQITTQDLRAYLAWLRTDYKPHRLSGEDHPLAPKTIRNVWVALSSFFAWASTEFGWPDPIQDVPPPRFEVAPVETFTKDEVEAILKACEYCKESKTRDRRKFTMHRATGNRDRAIILTLLDTGLRATELCSLKVGDVDMKTGRVHVRHGAPGGAKGGKGRAVFLGKSARRCWGFRLRLLVGRAACLSGWARWRRGCFRASGGAGVRCDSG